MSKLKEERFVKKWARECSYNHDCHDCKDAPKCGQAYQQIKEMIQTYAEHQELTANYIDIVIDLYDQLEQKKPEVDEEFVEKWADKFDGIAQEGLIIDIDLLKQMLREAGVKVVGK